jgi:DNA-binding CsgD family transcriptional regulator
MFTTNRTSWIKRLHCLPKATSGAASDTVRAHRTGAARLSSRQVAELIDSYQAGQTVYELAARFKIHRATVSAHLHRNGISMRRQGPDDDAIAQATRLYEGGWSVARIGDRLGVDGTTIRTALKAQGIRMRDAHRRER